MCTTGYNSKRGWTVNLERLEMYLQMWIIFDWGHLKHPRIQQWILKFQILIDPTMMSLRFTIDPSFSKLDKSQLLILHLDTETTNFQNRSFNPSANPNLQHSKKQMLSNNCSLLEHVNFAWQKTLKLKTFNDRWHHLRCKQIRIQYQQRWK